MDSARVVIPTKVEIVCGNQRLDVRTLVIALRMLCLMILSHGNPPGFVFEANGRRRRPLYAMILRRLIALYCHGVLFDPVKSVHKVGKNWLPGDPVSILPSLQRFIVEEELDIARFQPLNQTTEHIVFRTIDDDDDDDDTIAINGRSKRAKESCSIL